MTSFYIPGKPLYIECDITTRCNLRCNCCNRFCDIIGASDANDFTIEEMQSVLVQLRKYPIERFRILGGEPTLHPKLSAFCGMVLQERNIKHIELITNFQQMDVVEQIQKEYEKIVCCNFDGNSGEKIKTKKYLKHVNCRLTPQDSKQLSSAKPCLEANYMNGRCGIHISKLNAKIAFMYQVDCSAMLKMLCKEDLFFSNIDDLLASDHSKIFDVICQHCAYSAEFQVPFFKDRRTSKIFIEGLKRIEEQAGALQDGREFSQVLSQLKASEDKEILGELKEKYLLQDSFEKILDDCCGSGNEKVCYRYGDDVFKLLDVENTSVRNWLQNECTANTIFGSAYATKFVGVYKRKCDAKEFLVSKQPYVQKSNLENISSLSNFLLTRGFKPLKVRISDVKSGKMFQQYRKSISKLSAMQLLQLMKNGIYVNADGVVVLDLAERNFTVDPSGNVFLYNLLILRT